MESMRSNVQISAELCTPTRIAQVSPNPQAKRLSRFIASVPFDITLALRARLDHFPHQATFGLVGSDHRTAGTPGHHSGESAEIEHGHFLLVAVALDTVFLEDGKNFAFEKWSALGGSGQRNGCDEDGESKPHDRRVLSFQLDFITRRYGPE
jgi:hypothetical protein